MYVWILISLGSSSVSGTAQPAGHALAHLRLAAVRGNPTCRGDLLGQIWWHSSRLWGRADCPGGVPLQGIRPRFLSRGGFFSRPPRARRFFPTREQSNCIYPWPDEGRSLRTCPRNAFSEEWPRHIYPHCTNTKKRTRWTPTARHLWLAIIWILHRAVCF